MEVLTVEECWELLASVPIGRVGFLAEGEAMVLPVNFMLAGRRIAFRTARGTLLAQSLNDRPVTFEADDWEAVTRAGWSVVIRGMPRIMSEAESEPLALDSWADAVPRQDWVAILPEEISGRRIVR